MKNILSLIVAAAALLLTSNLSAQIGSQPDLPGCYEVLQSDGSPIRPNVTATLTIVPIPGTPLMSGIISADGGNGPQNIPGEEMVIQPPDATGQMHFENARGHYGVIYWDGFTYRSHILTGPNAGLDRLLDDLC
ncbi:MAG: hypothetical protein AB8H80_09320 [Planctomycetota bacterium]